MQCSRTLLALDATGAGVTRSYFQEGRKFKRNGSGVLVLPCSDMVVKRSNLCGLYMCCAHVYVVFVILKYCVHLLLIVTVAFCGCLGARKCFPSVASPCVHRMLSSHAEEDFHRRIHVTPTVHSLALIDTKNICQRVVTGNRSSAAIRRIFSRTWERYRSPLLAWGR